MTPLSTFSSQHGLLYHHRVNNVDPKIFPAPLAVIAIQKNFDCSITITQDQANQPVGTGWTVLLANPLNNTDVRPLNSPHLFPFCYFLLYLESFSYDQGLPIRELFSNLRVALWWLLCGSPTYFRLFYFFISHVVTSPWRITHGS